MFQAIYHFKFFYANPCLNAPESHLCKAIKVHVLMFLSLGSIHKPAAFPPAVLSAYMAEFFYVIPFDLLSIVLCNKSNKIISDM